MIWSAIEVRQRLGKCAKELGLRMPQVQTLFSQERFVARLAQLEDTAGFVWKGGSLVLRLYRHLDVPRFTVDVDLLVQGHDIGRTGELFEQAMAIDLDDGFEFLHFTKTEMARETPYGGERYEIDWRLFGKEQSESLKVDVCAGDDVDPIKTDAENLFLLPAGEQLSFSVYPAEFIFAEKLETADRFFTGNTRLKDFIDLWGLTKHPMDRKLLVSAIQRCFQRRNRVLDPERLQRLFTDAEFIRQMDRAKKKKFKTLPLPSIDEMFGELLTFIEDLVLKSG